MKTETKEYGEMLAGQSDAWETYCRRFVGGRMGVVKDELMIQ